MKEKSILLFNEAELPGPNAVLKSDQIGLANATRFTEAYFSEPLTTFAVGFRDPSDLQAALEFVAPRVSVGRRFEYASTVNKEEFYSETDDIRSIGSNFKAAKYSSTKTNAKTYNKGLTLPVDMDEVADQPNWREQKTAKLLRRLYRNDLRRAIALLSANATNSAKTWDTTALKDPDHDLLTDLIAGGAALGFNVNRVLFGMTAWAKRLLSLRAQNLKGQGNSSTMTPVELAQWLGVEGVNVSRERYTSSATARTEIVNNLVLEFFAESGMDTEDASNIKRFVSPVDGGGDVRVYEQQVSAKIIEITVEHYSNIVCTSTLGLRKLTIS